MQDCGSPDWRSTSSGPAARLPCRVAVVPPRSRRSSLGLCVGPRIELPVNNRTFSRSLASHRSAFYTKPISESTRLTVVAELDPHGRWTVRIEFRPWLGIHGLTNEFQRYTIVEHMMPPSRARGLFTFRTIPNKPDQ